MSNVKVHDSTIRKRRVRKVAGERFFSLKWTWQHILGWLSSEQTTWCLKLCPLDIRAQVWPLSIVTHLYEPSTAQTPQSIPESNIWPPVWQLKRGWNWVMQYNNEPKHSSKSKTECLKRKDSKWCNGPVKVQTLTWLKCCGGTLRELCINKPQRCKEERAKIPKQLCEKLITSYRKQLLQAIAAKGSSTKEWTMRYT